MADRYLLESGAPDGYQLEDASGVLILEGAAASAPIPCRLSSWMVAASLALSAFPCFPAFASYTYTEPPANPVIPVVQARVPAQPPSPFVAAKYHAFPFQPATVTAPATIPVRQAAQSAVGTPSALTSPSVTRITQYRPAFPTTGILDAFNRANEDPLNNSTWSARQSGLNNLRLVSNQIRANATSGDGHSYWSERTFGPDCELYADVQGLPGNGFAANFYVRLQGAGGPFSGQTGYVVLFLGSASPTDLQCIIRRRDGGASTDIFEQTIVASTFTIGDRIGVSMHGSVIRAWYRSGSGPWKIVASVDDATYTAAGRLAVDIVDSVGTPTIILDNVGGGTVSALDGVSTLSIRQAATPSTPVPQTPTIAFTAFPFQAVTVAQANPVIPVQVRTLSELRGPSFMRFPSTTSYVYNEEVPPGSPSSLGIPYRQPPPPLTPTAWQSTAQYLSFPFSVATPPVTTPVIPYRQQPTTLVPFSWHVPSQYLRFPYYTQNPLLIPKRWMTIAQPPAPVTPSGYFAVIPASAGVEAPSNPVIKTLRTTWLGTSEPSKFVLPVGPTVGPFNTSEAAPANPVIAIQNRVLSELRDPSFVRYPSFNSYVYNEVTPPAAEPASPVVAFRQQPTTLRPETWHVPARYLPFPYYTQNPVIRPKLIKLHDPLPGRMVVGGHQPLVPFNTSPPPPANPIIGMRTGQWIGDVVHPLVGIHGFLPFPWNSVGPAGVYREIVVRGNSPSGIDDYYEQWFG